MRAGQRRYEIFKGEVLSCVTASGKLRQDPLKVCNFDAKTINSWAILDDNGRIESRYEEVHCVHLISRTAVTVLLGDAELRSATSFAEALQKKLPPGFVVEFKMAPHLQLLAHDYVAEDVKGLHEPPMIDVNPQPGWWILNGEVIYQMPIAPGVITAKGIDRSRMLRADIVKKIGFLPAEFYDPNTGYGVGVQPPVTEADRQQAITGFMDAANIGPLEITAPAITYTHASSLISRGAAVNHIQHHVGDTGEMKTASQQVYASFQRPTSRRSDARGMARWGTTTANSLQKLVGVARDLMLCADDFKATSPDAVRQAGPLIQSFADQAVRQRLQQDGKFNENTPRPTSGLMSSGQDQLTAEVSTAARVVTLTIPMGALSKSNMTVAQKKASGIGRRMFYAGWLVWCAQHPDIIDTTLVSDLQDEYYARPVDAETHARLAGTPAVYAAVGELMRRFITETWPGHAEFAKTFADVALSSVERAVGEQQERVVESQPHHVVLENLSALLSGNRGHLIHRRKPGVYYPADALGAATGLFGVIPEGQPIGWFSEYDEDVHEAVGYFSPPILFAALRKVDPERIAFDQDQLARMLIAAKIGGKYGVGKKGPGHIGRRKFVVEGDGKTSEVEHSGIWIKLSALGGTVEPSPEPIKNQLLPEGEDPLMDDDEPQVGGN